MALTRPLLDERGQPRGGVLRMAVPQVRAGVPMAPMRPLRTLAVLASLGVGVSALITATSAALKAAGVDFGTPTAPGRPLLELLVFGTPILLAAFVATIAWLYRAQLNVHLLPDAHPRWASGWAIVGWFIPLANLVLVPLVAADAVRNTTPPHEHGRRRVLTALVVVWWLGFAGSTLVATARRLPQLDGAALPALEGISVALRLLSAPALIVLMLWLTRLQEVRFAQTVVQATPAPPAPAAPALEGPPALRSAVPPS